MNKVIRQVMVVALMVGSVSSAAFAKDALSEDYIMFCGSKTQIEDMFHAKGEKGSLTKKDLKELNESRQPTLDVLANGKVAIKKLLDEGNKADTGAFGVIIVCGVLNSIQSEVRDNGCIDLSTNQAVQDNGGLAACAEMINALPKN
ncbi:hypothetical protein [Bdellovibrio sp. HCB337]|uniref:hypothetical protein n=1 Tax=Bdellovibrio sp. HCB337 TaxID=3394358 RepID=UPI0039A55F4C